MIDEIRHELTKKIEEASSKHDHNYYYNLYGWSLLLSKDERKMHIEEVDNPNWCSELAVDSFDAVKLALMKSYILLLLHENNETAKAMLPGLKAFDILGEIHSSAFIDAAKLKLMMSGDFKKKVYSENNSKNASGHRNVYYKKAVEIMINTWKKIPSASKNRMEEKLIEYFGKDVSGKNKVSSSSIKRWIKENNLGPSIQASSPIDFSLVIRS